MGVHGDLAGWQARPDTPRTGTGGRVRKYELPRGQANLIDVPPSVRPHLGDPSIPLVITEGTLKADSAAGAGLCCVSISGVWGWRGRNTSGGMTALADFDAIALNGRIVVLAFDSDVVCKVQVQAALGRLAAVLVGRGAVIRYVRWLSDEAEPIGVKVGLDDWIAGRRAAGQSECQIVGEFMGLWSEAPPVADPDADRREPVFLGGSLSVQVDATVAALSVANDPPSIFQASERLAYLPRTSTGVVIRHHTVATFGEDLDRIVTGVRTDDEGEEVACSIPQTVLQPIFDRGGTGWAPEVSRVVESPIVRRDGSIASTSGYDAATSSFLDLSAAWPTIPEHPTDADLAKAVALFRDELLVDFRWENESDLTNFMAALITPLVRSAYDGCTPLQAFGGYQPGAGKGLLADIIFIIATGHRSRPSPMPSNDDELRKSATAILLAGKVLHLWDNLEGEIRSPILAALITAPTWSDRILGVSRNARVDNQTVFLATGNSIRIGGDLARRVVLITVITDRHDPQQRSGFRHADLPAWTLAHRHELVAALLVMVRHWFDIGCPPPSTTLGGGFEGWSHTAGGIVEAAGFTGFLSAHATRAETADVEAEHWGQFLASVYGGWRAGCTARDLARVEDGHSSGLHWLLPYIIERATGPEERAKAIGQAFHRKANRRYLFDGAVYSVHDDGLNGQKVRRWIVERGDAGTGRDQNTAAPDADDPPIQTDPRTPDTSRQHPTEGDTRSRPLPAVPAILTRTDAPPSACTVCGQPTEPATTLCSDHLLNGPA
jgi:hypothetical protein